MDPAGSKLEFVATFEKTPAPGVFKEFDTRLRFDPEQPAGGSLDVTVKVTSADMNIPDANKVSAARSGSTTPASRRPSSIPRTCAARKATATWRAARCR